MMPTVTFNSSESRLLSPVNGRRRIRATSYFWLNTHISTVCGEYRNYSMHYTPQCCLHAYLAAFLDSCQVTLVSYDRNAYAVSNSTNFHTIEAAGNNCI
jgi:hypothetical protein